MSAAPPAGPIVNRPPLGRGQAIRVPSLSDYERQQLAARGVNPDEPTPEDTADIIAQAAPVVAGNEFTRSAVESFIPPDEELPPPLPLDTPPVQFNPVDISQVSDAKRAEVNRLLQASMQSQRDAGRPLPENMATAQDMAAAAAKVNSPAPPETAEPAPKADPQESRTGAAPASTVCPHCEWPQNLKDDLIVTDEDKRAFVVSLVGDIPFQKTYKLFGDQLRLTVRTLSSHELDRVFQQAYHDRRTGKLELPQDFVEWLERYRFTLQIVRVETGAGGPLALPVSLERPTKEGNDQVWTDLVAAGDDPTVLRAAHEYLVAEVFPSESIMRVGRQTVTHFNRLVAKLEAQSLNPDF